MSTVIIVDSACELPTTLERSKAIKLLPINVTLGEKLVRDRYRSSEVLQMVAEGEICAKRYANSDPASAEQIISFLIKDILPSYDYAIVQTVSSVRSEQYALWNQVNGHFTSRYRNYRNSQQQKFSLNVIDSESAYGAQGLLAMETIRLAKKARSKRELIAKLKNFTKHIQSYSAPADLGYLRQRAKQRGDSTVGLVDTMIGKMLKVSPVIYGMRNQIGLSAQPRGHQNAIDLINQHAITALKKGMASPYINVSFGGQLSELEQMESLDELKYVAEQHDCQVFSSVSRLSSLINLGPGNFSLSFACNDPSFVIEG